MSDDLYVYVIGHDEGPQKVGFSNNPAFRARTLKVTGQPHYAVHFAAAVPAADALGRERFDVTVEEAIAAVEDAVTRYAAGERVPPRDDLMTERIAFMMPRSLINAVDDWRVTQRRIPTWSEAVRILVEQALDAEEARRG